MGRQARDNYDEACLTGTRRSQQILNEGLQSAKDDVEKYYWEVTSLKSGVDGIPAPAPGPRYTDTTPWRIAGRSSGELRKEALSIQDRLQHKTQETRAVARNAGSEPQGGARAGSARFRNVVNPKTPQRLSDSHRAHSQTHQIQELEDLRAVRSAQSRKQGGSATLLPASSWPRI